MTPAMRDWAILAAVLTAVWAALFALDPQPASGDAPRASRSEVAAPEVFRSLSITSLAALDASGQLPPDAVARFSAAVADPEIRAVLIEIADGLLARPLGPAELLIAQRILVSWDSVEPAVREQVPPEFRARIERLRERVAR
jgi:hypothetical protein